MVRGVDRRAIFFEEQDRRFLIERISSVFGEEGAVCLAWAFMPNHVHLVTRTGERPLARAMQRVGTAYGRYFNRRYERSGYVFQGRYKALAVLDDSYLLPLIRYVHRTPLEGGIVPSLEALGRYRWTGHAVLLGRREARFQVIAEILAWFGSTPEAARSHLCTWMRDISAESPIRWTKSGPTQRDAGARGPSVERRRDSPWA